jgi:phage gp29-like protein
MRMRSTPAGLLVPESVSFAEAAPDMNEVATTRDGRDITRGFVSPLELLQPQDTVLMGRGGGDLRVYEEILRDGQVHSTFQQRRGAVVAREWMVEPGGKKRLDQKAADAIREMLGSIAWDAVTNKMLYGIFYGYAVAECLWARDGAQVVLDKVKVRNRRRFKFAGDESLRLLTTANPQGEALPDRKFWVFCTGADNDDEPYGRGLAHWLYWPVFFKRNGLKFWLIFLEKFGTPTAVGEYPANATDPEKDRLLAALQAIQTDAGIIIPQGMIVRLLEAQRSGNIDQRTFLKYIDAEISKIVLSQTMTTDDGSSKSQADVHMDVRQDVVKSDADLVCRSFTEGPVRWLTEWNFPGAAVPQVWRKIEDEPDLKSEAERDKLVYETGYRRPLAHLQETYGGEWEPVQQQAAPEAPAVPGATPPGIQPAAAQFAERQPSDAPERLTAKLSDAAGTVLDGMVDQVRELVAKAASMEEVRDGLLELYGAMDPAQLGNLMQRAFVAAELAGRAEVVDESQGD